MIPLSFFHHKIYIVASRHYGLYQWGRMNNLLHPECIFGRYGDRLPPQVFKNRIILCSKGVERVLIHNGVDFEGAIIVPFKNPDYREYTGEELYQFWDPQKTPPFFRQTLVKREGGYIIQGEPLLLDVAA